MDFYKITNNDLSADERAFGVNVVEPIMGATLAASDYFKKVLPYYNQSGKLLTPSELGCSLSHISAYRKIVENNVAGIIFEADIHPSAIQLEAVKQHCLLVNVEFIHLGRHPNEEFGNYFKGVKSKTTNMYIAETLDNFYGGFAYFVSVSAAKELIEYHSKSIKLTDSWAIFFLKSKIIPYFHPVFRHPSTRNEMHIERLNVSQHVYALEVSNILLLLKKLALQKLAKFKFWKKPIKDEQ